MFEVPEQADPTDPTEGPTNLPPEVPEQANPTDPTEGPTDQPPEVPEQADPTNPTDGPTNQQPQQEQECPTDPEMPSDDPTDEPPTVPTMVPPVATTTASSSAFCPKVPTMGGLIQVKHDVYSAWTGGKPLADWTGLDTTAHSYEQPIALALKPSSPRAPASICFNTSCWIIS